eukprot:m.267873 g.267873  ORF g.267873 m.267873 type:complete len:296 (-) comp16251_c0_seq5:301-1188(-)
MGGTQSRVSKTMNGIGLYRYSPDKASWMVLKKDEKRQSEDVLELKVMTYNVWFDSSNRERRFHEILTMLDAENVHVACLQEMCAQTVQLVKESSIVREKYFITNPDKVLCENWYGTITLVKNGLPVSTVATYNSYHSRLGRGLTTIALMPGMKIGEKVLSGPLAIGNTHLESPVNGVTARDRSEQLYKAQKVLDCAPTHILVGDFNFTSESETRTLFEVHLTDVWRELRGDLAGITYDSKNNDNIHGPYVHRPDLITINQQGELKATSIQIVGDKNIADINVPPSDHYGLLATFR